MSTKEYNAVIHAANQIDLRACPFCGELPFLSSMGRLHYVSCGSCGARGPWNQDALDTFDAPMKAVERWEHRV